jgi:FixJ family two-component response regulator
MTSPPTVFIVDDSSDVLRALARLMQQAGLRHAVFCSAEDFLKQYNPAAPGCLVLDVVMPNMNGLDLQKALAANGSRLPIIFLTGHGDIPMCVRAMRRGASDFLVKPASNDDLLSAIDRALKHNDAIHRKHAEDAAALERLALLTPREHEVMTHVIAGKLNKQTAVTLGTTEKTIKVHRARVFQKLGIGSVAELTRLTERVGVKSAT